MICLKLATRTGSFQVEVDATTADCGVANINYERKPLAVPGTWNTGTNYADSRYQLPQIDSKELHSFTSLFTIGEALENLSHTSKKRQQFQVVADQVLEAFHQRVPDKSRFEIAVILQACAGASAMSMKEIHRRSQAEESLDAHTKHEIVRTAFATVRAID